MIDFSSQVNQFNDRLLSCSSRIAARSVKGQSFPTLIDKGNCLLGYSSHFERGQIQIPLWVALPTKPRKEGKGALGKAKSRQKQKSLVVFNSEGDFTNGISISFRARSGTHWEQTPLVAVTPYLIPSGRRKDFRKAVSLCSKWILLCLCRNSDLGIPLTDCLPLHYD